MGRTIASSDNELLEARGARRRDELVARDNPFEDVSGAQAAVRRRS